MKEKIASLIQKHETENQNILQRRPDLNVRSDFSPEGIRYYLNTVFIDELKTMLLAHNQS